MNDFELSEIELKVIETIRNSKDPAKALEIAIDVLISFLIEREDKACPIEKNCCSLLKITGMTPVYLMAC